MIEIQRCQFTFIFNLKELEIDKADHEIVIDYTSKEEIYRLNGFKKLMHQSIVLSRDILDSVKASVSAPATLPTLA